MYKIIDKNNFSKKKQYDWFSTFANPCYGFNVKMDVTKVVNFSKETKTSFFINLCYLITIGCSSIDELRMRIVNNEIRLYDKINPTFTVMTKTGVYENAGFKMTNTYKDFYYTAHEIIEKVKNLDSVKETYNDSIEYDDYYMTCVPWISLEGMSHPLPTNNPESSSCPRICWDKYRLENGHYYLTLNITVYHALVDGYPLSCAFNTCQNNFDHAEELLK